MGTVSCSVMQLMYKLMATLNETADWFNFIIPLLSIDYVSDAEDINSSVGGHFIDYLKTRAVCFYHNDRLLAEKSCLCIGD